MRFYSWCLGYGYDHWPTVVVVAESVSEARRKAESYVLANLADCSDFADYMKRLAKKDPVEHGLDGACV